MTSSALLLDAFAATVDAAASVPTEVAAYRPLTDAEFADVSAKAARLLRAAQTFTAVIAGETAYRSRPELGSAGLAQRHGHRTPEEMVKVTTGLTGQEAVRAVRVGRIVHESSGVADAATGEIPVPTEPWLAAVAAALAAGRIGVAAFDAIRNGLGRPGADITAEMLASAAARLCDEAATLDADRLYKRARALRDELDAAGIADREAERRERRSLRLTLLPDGMGRLVWNLPPEDFAIVKEIYDRATSPKLGGPRFRPSDEKLAESIFDDTRTVEQLGSDTFLQLMRAGAVADSSRLLGSGVPAVRVLVTATDLAARKGHGNLEGQHDPVSIETVERIACDAGIVPIVFDAQGRPLDVGREQRRFTAKQRRAMEARDGGCMAGDCDRPPSWCEAHHTKFWTRDRGKTDIDDGILLCKHHHLLFHNNKWEIERRGNRFWVIPPPDIDPKQTPVLMNSKSAAYRRLVG